MLRSSWAKFTFRPFSEARDYARSLGLQRYDDWRAFALSDLRPRDIPSNPREAYKEGFLGYPDWLGNPKRLFHPIPADTVRTSSSKHLNSQSFGTHLFFDIATKFTSKYRLIPLPREAGATYLLSKRGSNPDFNEDLCTPVSVSFTRKYKGVAVAHGLQTCKITGCQLVLEISDEELYQFPANSPHLRNHLAIRDANNLYEAYRVELADLEVVFDKYWSDQPLRSSKDWLLNHIFQRKEDMIWIKTLVDLEDTLLKPLKIPVSFPLYHLGRVSNVLLSDTPVLHRVAVLYRNGYAVWFFKMVNGMPVPFYVQDHLPLLVLPIRDETQKLVGVYVFPEEVLVTEKFLRNPDEQVRGTRFLRLYPPWIKASDSRSKKKQNWQNEWYLDLLSEEACAANRVRFSKILRGVQVAPRESS